MLLLAQALSATEPADIPYRLLRSDLPKASDRMKEAAFAVSVDRPVNRADVERLVCQILVKEKPPRYQTLNIRVFVDLNEYTPAIDSPDLDSINEQHQLAWYVWNRTLPRVRGRLVMTKDIDGNPLDPWQSREFNHEKACPSS